MVLGNRGGMNFRASIAIFAVGFAAFVLILRHAEHAGMLHADWPSHPAPSYRDVGYDPGPICKFFIERKLDNPEAADFGNLDAWRYQAHYLDEWTVFASLMAPNPYGAMMPAEYRCRIRRVGKNWALLALDQR